jgi:hypothetical protein
MDWKILVNQWRNEHSLRDEPSHHLVFTKTDDEPISFTPVRSEGGAQRCAEIRDTVPLLCYKSPAWMPCTGEPCGCRPTTSRNCNSSL